MSAAALVATRRSVLRLVAAAVAAGSIARTAAMDQAAAADRPPVAMWRSPTCGCCARWADYMRRAGFSVTVQDSDDMVAIKTAQGVPEALQSCHTALVQGYVIEGHVPASDILRLLAERPAGRGLAIPGMPASAPGMDQPGQPYTVTLFGAPSGERSYARHSGTEAIDAL